MKSQYLHLQLHLAQGFLDSHQSLARNLPNPWGQAIFTAIGIRSTNQLLVGWLLDGISESEMNTKSVFQLSYLARSIMGIAFQSAKKKKGIQQQSPWQGSMCFHQFGIGLAPSLISLTIYQPLCLLYSLSTPVA